MTTTPTTTATSPDAATATDLADQLVQFVATRDWVSFPEIARFLKDNGCDPHGELAMTLPGNLLLWTNMSEEFFRLMKELIESKRLYFHPTSPMVYIADGCLLQLPLAKRPPKGGYARPHWAPVVFRVVPMQAARQRAAR